MNRVALQGPMQRRAAEVYAALEGKTVAEVAAILGVHRHTVTRAARAYGVRFADYESRTSGAPRAPKPRPQTRVVVNGRHTHDPNGDGAMRITLPAEPWHVEE